MATHDELEEQAEQSGYGATRGEADETPEQVLPDPPLQPDRDGEEPHMPASARVPEDASPDEG